MKKIHFSKLNKDYLSLSLICLIILVVDRIWFFYDESIPSYDQSAHLTTALHHYRVFQNFNIFSQSWWLSLWQLTPSYRAPFVYICTVPFLLLFGKGYDQASLVNLIYTVIIIFCVYYLGNYLFNNRKIGIIASIFCGLFPILGIMRTDYLLDYGLTAVVTFTFTILTIWKNNYRVLPSWILTILLGLGIGLIMLAKPTGFIFILCPSLWVLVSFIRNRKLLKIVQTISSLIVAWLICGGWYSLNWLTIITSALNANNVGKTEGDPSVTTIAGWLAYPQMLPETVGMPILAVSLGMLLVYLIQRYFFHKNSHTQWQISSVNWLSIFLLSSYFICSLGTNKDIRFILPVFPIVSLILAYFFNLIQNEVFNRVRVGTLIISALLLIHNLFPISAIKLGSLQHFPSQEGKKYPLSELINTINETNPYLRTTLGIIPVSTPEVNEFTLDYFGTLADFRVYGRKLTTKLSQVQQDLQSFNWYVTRDNEPDEPGERGETKRQLKSLVESSVNLKLEQDWVLPSGDKLRLYHRKHPDVVLEKINTPNSQIKLEKVIINNQVARNQNNSVSYQVTGNWEELQNGLLILKWHNGQSAWYHDHAIGLGRLYCGLKCHPDGIFQVNENLATFIPSGLPLGQYQLSAQYLDRRNGQIKPLDIPEIIIEVTDNFQPDNSASLDLVSRMSQLARELQQGKLDHIFVQIDNFNQYDPLQDYLKQIELAANYHLQTEPDNLNWRYTLVLSQLLQRQVPELIANLKELTKYDGQNPYTRLYLAFVYLYNFQPVDAEKQIQIAEKMQPDIPELKTLKTITNIMKFIPLIRF
ncbi:hypothetical protein B6N60_00994 [Richelia sinica FACHB-800]|uniref:Glycosyltransferase RgtA/B/C/D-like domain-containing protein n=1 Tax=Richelia sinica FACHB-800 TaxID=1357546 RepID=A0A975T539_9NOST|nr:hypothetical protein [Richelia sinica]MBD2664931.1 hypothetical protein [Richelia sinica FACHB-800]QXE22312.1 hypothetical protein B6N60_00994 [Richelia sinica FACHB-800]